MKKYTLHIAPSARTTRFDEELNRQQLEAVTCAGGPMLVLAGAGTGKTRTLTYRVAWLVENGVLPSNILLLTFTNKASKEMMRRAASLIGADVAALWGGTFHHIGNLILKRHAGVIGYKDGFSILDRTDTKDLFDTCRTSVAAAHKDAQLLPKASILTDLHSYTRNTSKTAEAVIRERFPALEANIQLILDVIALYEKKKRELNLVDFDDILQNMVTLLKDHEDVRDYYSRRFQHVLVDEYQDTNSLQAEVVELLSSYHRNIMAVGDDAQSIFSFRGANFENILNFQNTYPDAQIFKLTTNYRSTPQILNAANAAIAANRRQFCKNLVSVREGGQLPAIVPLEDTRQQALFVASMIKDTIDEGGSLSSMAVLYRSHYQSMEVQMELTRLGIPYDVRSGMKFFEQAHIKDILAYLRIISNPCDEISWKRLLKMLPGIGNATADKIWRFLIEAADPLDRVAAAGRIVPKKGIEHFTVLVKCLDELRKINAPSEALDTALKGSYEKHLFLTFPDADNRLRDLTQLSEYAVKYNSTDVFLSEMAIQGSEQPMAAADSGGGGTDEHVVLSSIHQAKGLEWKTVFVIGLNDGQFPSIKSGKNWDEEEERRLFYVALTRACDELYLCYAYTSYAGLIRPSRFIKDIPRGLFEEIEIV
ncbi:ATP-dependent helicase [Candidatus Magnetominusculus dajiuhuensis]|uniref:ATP-dependent helicase n=1 Tax=Candidatus Magnetominusculus dajiuhuensis TaxID=3137712 RepID=UPI003B431E7E